MASLSEGRRGWYFCDYVSEVGGGSIYRDVKKVFG